MVIEVKKDTNEGNESFDVNKLKAFTSQSDDNYYKYTCGLLIKIPVTPYFSENDYTKAKNIANDPKNKPILRWFYEGKEVKFYYS